MKIGIITMYYRRNYGGVLQSYALFQTLKKQGHDVRIINYKIANSINTYHPIFAIQYLIKKIRTYFSIRRHSSTVKTKPLSDELLRNFADFKYRYLQYSEDITQNNLTTVVNQFDAIVFGSDQIWNAMNKKLLVYFGDFGGKVNCRKIAYAPCSIYSNAPCYNKTKLKGLLNSFKALSARDTTTAKLVENIVGIKPQIVADPTVLYSFEEFVVPAIRQEKYIFAYILGSEIDGGHKVAIEKIFEKIGKVKVVAVVISDVSLEAEKFADEVLYTASPADWVNLVANSEYVYTDSFHGIMFAMKFHKPFLAYYKDASRASRLLDIKKTYNIQNIVPSLSEFDIDYEIDYNMVDIQLNKFRELSLNYLSEALV